MKWLSVLCVAVMVVGQARGESDAAKICLAGYKGHISAIGQDGKNSEVFCGALHALTNCAIKSVENANERVNIQKFVDSQQFVNNCIDSKHASSSQAQTAVTSNHQTVNFRVPREKDIKFRRRASAESIDVFELNAEIASIKVAMIKSVKQKVREKMEDTKTTLVNSLQSTNDLLSRDLVIQLGKIDDTYNELAASIKDEAKSKLQAAISVASARVEQQLDEVRQKVAATKAAGEDAVNSATQMKADAQAEIDGITKDGEDGIKEAAKKSADSISKSVGGRALGVLATSLSPYTNPKVAKFKWKTWATYDQGHGWIFGNRREFFGGVHASQWTDGNAVAWSMNGNKDQLRQLFTDSMTCTSNKGECHVYSKDTRQYSTTNSQMVGVWIRLKNTGDSNVNWRMEFYVTGCSDGCQGGQQNRASLTINGNGNWHSGGHQCAWCHRSQSVNVPRKRTSSIILIGNGGRDSGDLQTTAIAFDRSSLKLPENLEWAWDQDYATGGWEK